MILAANQMRNRAVKVVQRCCAAAFLTVLIASQPCLAADTLLGSLDQSAPPGTGLNVPKIDPPPKVYRDPNGVVYYKTANSKVWPPKGTKVKLTNGTSIFAQSGVNNPNTNQFVTQTTDWANNQIAGLAPQPGFSGLSFYPLNLTDELRALGNAASLWGTEPPNPTMTDALVACSTNDESGEPIASILGSATPDGHTPIRIDFLPTDGLGVEWYDDSHLRLAFDPSYAWQAGSGIVTNFHVVGVPEPASLALLGIGLLLLVTKRR